MQGPHYSASELLARLVSFDTTSAKSNMALIRFVEDYLAQHGVRSELVPSADGEKASLFATIGPKGIPGIALSGHTDVVPVAGQRWDSDPFRLVERDGRLYGRGTTDMKGFVACVLAAVPDLVRRPLKIPLHIVLSYDEEIGCVGVRPMLAELGHRLIRPLMAIVGEPTGMTVVDAHKGPARWTVDIRGRAAHTSMAHLGVNAVHYGGRLMGEIDRLAAELKEGRNDPRFDPPFVTLQVTQIEGGTATNIVPVSCRFSVELRSLPGVDVRMVEDRLSQFARKRCLPEMQAVAPEADITIHLVNYVPPFAADTKADVVPLALRLMEQNRTHAVSYATEAGLFQDAGVPAVVCGPGSISQAHTADEWIAVSEIERCSAFISRLADWAEG